MKKSNRVFIALIATLYIVPALTFGVAPVYVGKMPYRFHAKVSDYPDR